MTIEEKMNLIKANLIVFNELTNEDKISVLGQIKGMALVRNMDKLKQNNAN